MPTVESPGKAAFAPMCATLVGRSSSIVTAAGFPYCLTSPEAKAPSLKHGQVTCTDGSGKVVWFWTALNPQDPDENIYAAKQGGDVVIVPVTSAEKQDGVPTLDYLKAAGCASR
jgi:hypothetical protein